MLKADFHVHTTRSPHPFYGKVLLDGLNSPREMAEQAARKGLDVIAITDHKTFFPRQEAEKLTKETGVLIIPGAELSLGRKEVIVLGVESVSSKNLNDLKQEVDKKGGVLIACHPFDPLGRGHKNVEDFHAVEVQNGFSTLRHFDQLSALADKHKKSKVCGSDAHWTPHLGYIHCLVDAEKNVESVLDAIKTGKVEPVKSTIPRVVFFNYYLYKQLAGAWIWRKR